MDKCLSGIAILVATVSGFCFAWYDVFQKFEGESHMVTVPMGGLGKSRKLAPFIEWERKRERAIRIGLTLLAISSMLQAIALFLSK